MVKRADVSPPLSDLRIIAIEQFGAGPFGSVHLAELGADVIKIEDPAAGGDVGRAVPPFAEDGDSLYFQTFNHNKRSITLDLETEAGRWVFERLVEQADAVYSNLRGDVPARLRIRYADLAHVNPRIVCCSLSAFGTDGPRAAEPGYDNIIQGLAGWMSLTGEPDGPPTKTGLSLVDFASGYAAIAALLAGVHAARRDGIGMDCDVSLFDTAVNLLSYVATWQLTEGYTAQRMRHSAHATLVPFQNFETADGWIVIGCAKEKFWPRLCDALELSELTTDPRFANFESRHRNRDVLLPLFRQRFLQRPNKVWLDRLHGYGVPAGPVNDLQAALCEPQLEEREQIAVYDHPRFGTVRLIRTPLRVGQHRAIEPAPSTVGQDTGIVARDLLGLADEKVEALHAAGAFGPIPRDR